MKTTTPIARNTLLQTSAWKAPLGAFLGLLFSFFFLPHPAFAAEIARPTETFIDSIGINTHLCDTTQFYNLAVFGSLGIRHFRDNSPPVTASQGYQRLSDLYSHYGIRCNMACDRTEDSITDRQFIMKQPLYESIEGLNEPDIFGPRIYFSYLDSWALQTYAATIEYQNDLYNAMNADTDTQTKPVLSPPMATIGRTRGLRTCSFDAIALHWYDGGGFPTSSNLDSTAMPAAALQQVPGGEVAPLYLTEVGWQSPGNGWQIVSDTAAGKYIPRTLAECFNRGITRTYIFEMSDTPNVYNYGIVRANGLLKPAYTALQNLIALLREGTWNAPNWQIPSFIPGELDYTMGGATANVRHLLLQKSNGQFYLLLWQDVKSFNTANGQDVAVPAANIKLAFNTPVSSAATYRLSSTNATGTFSNPKTLSLGVPDDILLVKIVPNSSPANVPSPAVTILAQDAQATESFPGDPGQFTVYRTGGVGSSLTVNLTIDGNAVNGVHYNSIPASVVIPAGASNVAVPVTPKGLTNINGDRNIIATIAAGSYNIGNYQRTAQVRLLTGNDSVANFDGGSLSGWSSQPFSTLALTGTNTDAGAGALKWTFGYTGANPWGNEVVLTFPTPQDWSSVSKLVLRFAEDAANPVSDKGCVIFFDFYNSGTSASANAGVTSFQMCDEPAYRTIELPLGSFSRDKVNSLRFYVNGSNYSVGNHTWYMDNIRTDSTPQGLPLCDFENAIISNWSTQPLSTLAINTTSPNSGVRDLKWTYTDDGSSRWGNQINLDFATPVDLTKKRKLVLRFAVSSTNPSGDVGQPIYLDLVNNGTSASSNASVSHLNIAGTSTAFTTVELDLSTFPREKVSRLYFYVDGNNFSTGTHVWRLDDITLF